MSLDPEVEELRERNRMLTDIALSALALKLNIEHGFTPPPLHALNRDLDTFQRRFGGIIEMDRSQKSHRKAGERR